MVAIAVDSPALQSPTAPRRYFYVGLGVVFVLIAFGGFVPTYWARLAAGSFGGAPILHIHGTLFFTWTLFYLMQTTLVARGRTLDHRSWGLAGIALATAMVCSVVLAAINSVRVAQGLGMAEQALRFTIVSLSGAVLFAGFFGTAITQVKRPELHKRLMVLAMIPLMHAAMGRVFLTLFAPPGAKGPPPVIVSVPPGLFVDLLLIAAMVYDWRTRGRPHPVYWIGGAILLANQAIAVMFNDGAAWLAIARGVVSLAG